MAGPAAFLSIYLYSDTHKRSSARLEARSMMMMMMCVTLYH